MKHAVCSIIRLISAGFVLFGGIEVGLEIMQHRVQHHQPNLWHYLIGSALLVFGFVFFAVSSSLASRLTDEDDDEPSSPPSDP
jgi:hypothetical protein